MQEVQQAINKHGLNIRTIRDEFPMFKYRLNGKQRIYFDSAATTHKTKRVIVRLQQLYLEEYTKCACFLLACIHKAGCLFYPDELW